jgi:acyl-phosphate glycerol 3-phosphate acyltransferase
MNTVESNTWLALIAAIAYLIGSFPTAYFVTKGMVGKDIRLEGSHNVGGMNAYSLIRSKRSEKRAALGLIVILLGDMGKGVLAIYLTRWLGFLGYSPHLALITGSFFAILGHNYPFCFKFREGGIGFASFLGILLALNPFSLGVWGGTMLFCIFVAERILVKKWNLNSLHKVISVIGTQVPGRLIGMCIALVPIYFFDSQLLFPVLGPTILVYIKHAARIRTLTREPRRSQK